MNIYDTYSEYLALEDLKVSYENFLAVSNSYDVLFKNRDILSIEGVKDFFKSMVSKFVEMVKRFVEWIKTLFNRIKSFFKKRFSVIGNALTSGVGASYGLVSNPKDILYTDKTSDNDKENFRKYCVALNVLIRFSNVGGPQSKVAAAISNIESSIYVFTNFFDKMFRNEEGSTIDPIYEELRETTSRLSEDFNRAYSWYTAATSSISEYIKTGRKIEIKSREDRHRNDIIIQNKGASRFTLTTTGHLRNSVSRGKYATVSDINRTMDSFPIPIIGLYEAFYDIDNTIDFEKNYKKNIKDLETLNHDGVKLLEKSVNNFVGRCNELGTAAEKLVSGPFETYSNTISNSHDNDTFRDVAINTVNVLKKIFEATTKIFSTVTGDIIYATDEIVKNYKDNKDLGELSLGMKRRGLTDFLKRNNLHLLTFTDKLKIAEESKKLQDYVGSRLEADKFARLFKHEDGSMLDCIVGKRYTRGPKRIGFYVYDARREAPNDTYKDKHPSLMERASNLDKYGRDNASIAFTIGPNGLLSTKDNMRDGKKLINLIFIDREFYEQAMEKGGEHEKFFNAVVGHELGHNVLHRRLYKFHKKTYSQRLSDYRGGTDTFSNGLTALEKLVFSAKSLLNDEMFEIYMILFTKYNLVHPDTSTEELNKSLDEIVKKCGKQNLITERKGKIELRSLMSVAEELFCDLYGCQIFELPPRYNQFKTLHKLFSKGDRSERFNTYIKASSPINILIWEVFDRAKSIREAIKEIGDGLAGKNHEL